MIKRLDISIDEKPQEGFMSMRMYNGDIIHDPTTFPYPIDSGSINTVICTRVLERLYPRSMFITMMNELWRICADNAQVAMRTPYGVNSHFLADPHNCLPVTHATFLALDPLHGGEHFTKSNSDFEMMPWNIDSIAFDENGYIEIVLRKISIDVAKEILAKHIR